MKSSILWRTWNADGSRRPLQNSSTNVFLGVGDIFEVGVEVGSDALVMPDVFICRKSAIASLPKCEKERVSKSKTPFDRKSSNDSSEMVAYSWILKLKSGCCFMYAT